MTGFWTSVTSRSNRIYLTGYDGRGTRVRRSVRHCPTSYVPDPAGDHIGLNGTRLRRYRHESLYEASRWRKERSEVTNAETWGDVDPIHEFLADEYPGPVGWDPSLVGIVALDIEVSSEHGFPDPQVASAPIHLITVRDLRREDYITWGTVDFDPDRCEERVEYRRFDRERDMLSDFLDWWVRNRPDVVTGWYCDVFDIPYLVNRTTFLIGAGRERAFSPFEVVEPRVFRGRGGREYHTVDALGLTILDGLQLFRKFGDAKFGQQESYKLNTVAQSLLGRGKLDFGEHGSLRELAEEDPQKYVEYNVRDVGLVVDIERKTNHLTIAYELCFRAKCAPSEALGTVGIWEALLYNYLRERDVVVPPRLVRYKSGVVGGYVKDPKPGMYGWVVSFDFASLYPNLIRAMNVSPETITDDVRDRLPLEKFIAELDEGVKARDHECVSVRGNVFQVDREGFIPAVIRGLFEERAILKTELAEAKTRLESGDDDVQETVTELDVRQHVIKIFMNSLYGAMLNDYFRYSDVRMGESITLTGQYAIQWAECVVNRYLSRVVGPGDYVIAMDTDSLYIDMQPLVDRFMSDADPGQVMTGIDRVCREKFEPMFESVMRTFCDRLGAREYTLDLTQERLCDRALWSIKKRYALRVVEEDRVRLAKPKIVAKGLESARSSTPAVLRTAFLEAIEIGFSEDAAALRRFVSDRRLWFSGLYPEDIASPSGVTDVDKYVRPEWTYASGTPIHVRAAILHNRLVEQMGLTDQVEFIRSGDKMKYVYLRLPNPIMENVIGFVDVLPAEFGLHEHVDYDTQFEKKLLTPLETLYRSCGWNVRDDATLEDFV